MSIYSKFWRRRVGEWPALLFTTACLAVGLRAEPARPNIILIVADDMGFSDVGCYGGEIQTPNIDRLAREGMMFTQFYNNAKCTTTRVSLLSGMYPRGKGTVIPLNIPTIAEVLRGSGYQTGMSGKWHFSGGDEAPQRPVDRGFDEYYGLMDGACNYFNPGQRDPAFKNHRVRSFGHNEKRIHEFPDGFYTTDAFTTHAAETINRFQATGRPFFFHLAFTAPHYPLHAWPEDIAKYRGKYKEGWEALRRQRFERQLAMGLFDPELKLSPTDVQVYDWAEADQDWEDLRMATYAAMVDRMDQNIGRILETLTELGIEENTVVIFLSDNGGCAEEPGGRDPTQQPGIASTYTAVGPAWGWAQNAPFRRYKLWANEGGISTPLIVRWPGQVEAGTKTAQVAHIIDILPSCLDLAGGNYPREFGQEQTAPLEGRTLLPIWKGGRREPPSQLCWEWNGNCAIRQGRWKLVWDTLNPRKVWELYDIEADRTELNDLAAKKPELVRTLAAAYDHWARSTGRPDRRMKFSASSGAK